MKRKYIFIGFLIFLTQLSIGQNAPVTKAGSVLNATSGTISIPVTVTDFENIGAISLELNFDPGVVTFTGSTHNSVFSTMLITNPSSGTIIVGWSDESSSVTLPDDSQLFELEFTYISGSSSISWNDNGSSCQYADGSVVVLNDTPTSDYYIDGYVTSHAAPVTYAPVITDAGGSVDVPIIVNNFWDVGSITLSLEYDPTVLTYNSNTQNSAFGSSMIIGNLPSSGNKYKITMSWVSGSPVTLADGSTLITLHFTYSSSSSDVNYSELKWLTDGTACAYGDANSDALYDLPYDQFYIDGLVAGQVAPQTFLPVISTAVDGNNVTIPVTVTEFQDIGAVALVFEYDATVLTYVGNSPNGIFGTNMEIGNLVTGNTGQISIGYFGAPVSLTDLESIADIEFTYISGTSALTFITDGNSCAYGDASYNGLWDKPYDEYYFDGVVAGQVSPVIKVESLDAVQGTQISVPVKVWDFDNISSVSLSLDYDPGVLTYLNVTPNNEIGGFFNDGTNSSGRIQVGWYTGSPATLADESVLFYMNFTYNGGTSTLSWYDNGGSCQIAAGILDEVLYDQPTEDYYINGLVEPADFIWTGATSTDWNEPSNWSDNIVPNNLSVVSIPSTPPPNWPEFTGDFTIGDECNKINFDVSSEMTVTGDFTINPGKAFVNAGSGILKVGGDWLNSGVFVPQTGEVIFNSQAGSYIPAGVLPANEVQNYLPTSVAASMTPISGGNTGPTGENAHSDVSIGFNFDYAGITYSNARINTNGWVSLNLTGHDASAYDNGRLFFNSDPTTVLAPWWDNLEADGSSVISYITSGVAPNRVFTVEWSNMLSYNIDASERINFQLKLYESTNEIVFCYGSIVPGTNNPDEGASIGIKGPVGGTGDFIEATTGTSNTAISNLTSSSNWPVVNYIFTPPPDTVTFYNLTLDANAILNIETNVKITGENP